MKINGLSNGYLMAKFWISSKSDNSEEHDFSINEGEEDGETNIRNIYQIWSLAVFKEHE